MTLTELALILIATAIAVAAWMMTAQLRNALAILNTLNENVLKINEHVRFLDGTKELEEFLEKTQQEMKVAASENNGPRVLGIGVLADQTAQYWDRSPLYRIHEQLVAISEKLLPTEPEPENQPDSDNG